MKKFFVVVEGAKALEPILKEKAAELGYPWYIINDFTKVHSIGTADPPNGRMIIWSYSGKGWSDKHVEISIPEFLKLEKNSIPLNYRSYTIDEAARLIQTKVRWRDKESGFGIYVIGGVIAHPPGVTPKIIVGVNSYSLNEFLELFVHEDGSPCGVKEKKVV